MYRIQNNFSLVLSVVQVIQILLLDRQLLQLRGQSVLELVKNETFSIKIIGLYQNQIFKNRSEILIRNQTFLSTSRRIQ